MFDWLDNTVIKLCTMPPVGTDLNTVKDQLNEMKVCTWERVLKEDCFTLGFVCFVFGSSFSVFWLRAVFIAVCCLSPVAASGGWLLSSCSAQLLIVASLVAEHRLQLLAVHRLTCPVACGIFSHQG